MDEGTSKTPIPKCRLYWCFCLGWCSNFVGSESGQKQSVKLLQNMVWSILKKRRHLGFDVFIFDSSMNRRNSQSPPQKRSTDRRPRCPVGCDWSLSGRHSWDPQPIGVGNSRVDYLDLLLVDTNSERSTGFERSEGMLLWYFFLACFLVSHLV